MHEAIRLGKFPLRSRNIHLFLLLYADDIIIFANSAQELQTNLDILSEYCTRNRLVVNTGKTKFMIFRRGGILPRDLKFYYNEIELAIVNKFSYLGIVFSTGGSFFVCQETLAGQGMKAILSSIDYYIQYYKYNTKT